MKLSREWKLVHKPTNEIMDIITVDKFEKLNTNVHQKVLSFLKNQEQNSEMEVQFFINGERME